MINRVDVVPVDPDQDDIGQDGRDRRGLPRPSAPSAAREVPSEGSVDRKRETSMGRMRWDRVRDEDRSYRDTDFIRREEEREEEWVERDRAWQERKRQREAEAPRSRKTPARRSRSKGGLGGRANRQPVEPPTNTFAAVAHKKEPRPRRRTGKTPNNARQSLPDGPTAEDLAAAASFIGLPVDVVIRAEKASSRRMDDLRDRQETLDEVGARLGISRDDLRFLRQFLNGHRRLRDRDRAHRLVGRAADL